ncbi:Stage II sporulation protein E [uncultured Clostridium sp.]|nr:Stage II sporulation protein E [uncultured Clostridium sp.]
MRMRFYFGRINRIERTKEKLWEDFLRLFYITGNSTGILLYESEREGIMNPYVIQMDRFAQSLKHLSETFLSLEEYKGAFTKDEVEEMFLRVSESVCEGCEKKEWCLKENRSGTRQMVYEILCTVEDYGAELNIEVKRKLQKRCVRAPRFLRETLEVFGDAKQKLLWNNRIVQNREGCAVQLTEFARIIQHATRELDAGIFSDEHLEKRIRARMKHIGVKLLSSVFFMTEQGRYEIHLTVKAVKGQCVTSKEVAEALCAAVNRKMLLKPGERQNVGGEYCVLVCIEGPAFYTMQGVAKIGKGCEKISGDTFSMTKLPGVKEAVVLSDGMGSGEEAFKESARVVEMLEELLEAGFPVETAIQMMNTALVIGREEVRFSTVDMCVFDLYEGSCELVKAGASATFIRYADHVEKIVSSTLPIGVVQNIEIDRMKRELSDGDFVIMMTDGVLDALPVGEQEALMSMFIGGTGMNNPKELAHHILEQVLEWTGEEPLDDMTVIAVGIWSV